MVSTPGGQGTNRGSASRWRLKLLGGVELCGEGGRIPLEGRIAAALAYVAWSAPTPKAQLAGLLWPDTEPSQERNNLRQLLRRLRLACGEPVLQSVGLQDALVLDESVDCDLLQLRDAARQGRSEEVLQLQGELLAGMDFDELPELTRWLDGARLAAEGWFRKLIGLELRRREESGDLLGAISAAELWLSQEPESEPIARTLMRLHNVTGSRHAALNVYEQLKVRLSEELGVSPTEETASLARRIARSLHQERCAAVPAVSTPLQLRRPWLRVGRESTWSELQAGWSQSRVLCVAGEPGVGKSRIAMDFAASKGNFIFVAGHPADPGTPWSTVTRALRQGLAAAPGVTLPPWVRTELSQLLPELSAARRTRHRRRSARGLMVCLHAALAQGLGALAPGAASAVLDNLQWWDAESLGFLSSWIASLESPDAARPETAANEGPGLRALCCLETSGEPLLTGSAPRDWGFLSQAYRVELGALSREELQALVTSLALPGASAQLADAVWQFSGGNPALALEALRDWVRRSAEAAAPGAGGTAVKGSAQVGSVEVGSVEVGSVEVGSEQVAAVARARVARLHPAALEVARVAALTQEAFDTALAAEVLELPERQVGLILQRLQRMGLVWQEPEDAPFVSVCGALVESPADTATQLLQARCAQVLARRPRLVAATGVEPASRAG